MEKINKNVRLLQFFLLLLIGTQPALAGNFFSKVTVEKNFERVKKCNNEYRYGFNGKMKDNEWAGLGNHYDLGARLYDPRTVHLPTPDPLFQKYPMLSPYIFAADNPIRYVDYNGLGPGDRIQAARNMKGIPYKQQTDIALRTEATPKALEYMDCSEFVCRVMKADGITEKVESMPTATLKGYLGNKDKFTFSDKAQVGDIALWEGHVGIVTEVDKNGNIKLIHETHPGGEASENKIPIAPEKYHPSGKFIGYYRPNVETPDGKVKPEPMKIPEPKTATPKKEDQE